MDTTETQSDVANTPLAMDTLKFTPRSIKELEDKIRRPILQGIGQEDMNTLCLFVQKGLNMNEDQAFQAIQNYIDSGKDTTELRIFIIKRLEEQGFLSRQVNLSDKIQKAITETAQADNATLAEIGRNTNQ